MIASLGRGSAFNAIKELMGNDFDPAYSQARDARLISRSNAAIATTPVDVTFFTAIGAANGNLPIAGVLGDYYFLCHDVRVVIAEATGCLGKELDVANLGVNLTLSLALENRPVIDQEMLGLYLWGPAGRYGVTGTTAVVGSIEPGANGGHHCLWATTPGQAITGGLHVLTAPVITAATYAWIVLFGWKFMQKSAA